MAMEINYLFCVHQLDKSLDSKESTDLYDIY